MRLNHLLAATVLAAAALPSAAQVFTLDFEGAGDEAQLLDFYNGGTDSLGNSGIDFGVGFGSNALTSIDEDAGGGGNIANEPSPSTVLFFLTGSAVLNYEVGFTNGFSFFYSAAATAPVMVYDGLNATGNLLGTINLAAQFNDNCTGDPNGSFCNWTPAGVSFSGVAKSIDFGGTVNQVGYDNITFGSANPVPEPETYALMALGLALVGVAARRRKTP